MITKWQERREDYALEVVPESYRMWSWPSLFGVMLSVPTAIIYFSFGGGLVLMFGTRTLFYAMLISTVFVGSVGYLLAATTARAGLDTDLLTISSGFGYKGSGFTSAIYAVNFPVFFALEGSIVAVAIHTEFPAIPLWSVYLIFGAAFIPLGWYGLTTMNYMMWLTLPVYIVLLIFSLKVAGRTGAATPFWSYQPNRSHDARNGPAVLQILSAVFAFIINASNSGDIGRMIPARVRRIAAFAIGYGYEAVTFLGATMLGAWFAIKLNQPNPGIYMPMLLGVWGAVLITVSQLRINMLNTYSGSLAFANFFYRLFGFRPGRHWMVMLVVAISTSMMFAGILDHIYQVLTFEGIFTVAWIMAVTSDIVLNKRLLRLSPDFYTTNSRSVPAFDPIGLVSICIALVVSLPLAFGLVGHFGQTLAPFVSGSLAFVLPPILALIRARAAYTRLQG